VATWILALSPTAIRYSVEVKQYSTDLAIGAGLMVLALRAVDHRVTDGRQDRHAVAQWGIAGLVAVWISHPAVLIMAATAVVLGADSMRRSGRRERRVAALACVPWVLGFAADWWVSLRVLGRDPFLHSYWAAGFPPHPFGLPSYVAWVVRATSHVAADPGAIHFAGVAAIVAVIGLALVVAQKPLEGLLLVAPLVVALGAASIGSYPLDGRLVLWLLPLLAIGLAGVTINRPVGALVVAVLVLQPVGSALSVAAHPTTWQDSRPLFQAVARARQPHDEVWIHQSDLAVGDFYGRLTGVVPTNAVQDSGVPGGCGGANLNLAGVAGPSRVWFIYGYHQSNAAPDEEQAVVAKLRSVAHLVATIRRPQTAAYLFDFAQTPDTGPANGDLACVTVTRL
jgi:hypothetical protein